MGYNTRHTYSISASGAVANNTPSLSIINNSETRVIRINRITNSLQTSAAITGSMHVFEAYKLSASSTGGTNITANVTKYDVSSPGMSTGLEFYLNATNTVSGNPLSGGGFYNEEGSTDNHQTSRTMYLYRGGGNTKQLTLRPGEWLAIIKVGTATNVGNQRHVVEFTVDVS